MILALPIFEMEKLPKQQQQQQSWEPDTGLPGKPGLCLLFWEASGLLLL